MKKYNVFKVYKNIDSYILSYSTESFAIACMVRNLLQMEDDKHDYVVMEVLL